MAKEKVKKEKKEKAKPEVKKMQRIRPDYEALDSLSSMVHFIQYGRTLDRSDGAFPSVFRGQSMEFEDLRPYVPGDNLRDMDWKSTSRAGIPMVRNYVGDKRKQIIFIADTGKTMKGTMPDGNDKRECVLLSLGTAAYLSMRSGADISIICGDDWKSRLNHFERGGGYFEESMDLMQHALFKDTEKEVKCPEVWEVIDMILDMPLRGVSICLVTDLKGMYDIPEKALRAAASGREFYAFEISDGTFDRRNYFDVLSDRFIPGFFSRSKKLSEEIWKKQEEYQTQVRNKLRRCGVVYAYLEDEKEIPETVTKVLNGEITD